MYSLKCLSILTVTKIGDCDLWRRARLQIKKNDKRSRVYVTDARSVFDLPAEGCYFDKSMGIEGALLRETVRRSSAEFVWLVNRTLQMSQQNRMLRRINFESSSARDAERRRMTAEECANKQEWQGVWELVLMPAECKPAALKFESLSVAIAASFTALKDKWCLMLNGPPKNDTHKSRQTTKKQKMIQFPVSRIYFSLLRCGNSLRCHCAVSQR